MTEKEVRKLGRRDLLEMLLVQARELEDVKRQLSEKTRELEAASTAPRTTSDPAEPETAGSIAEAALQLNGLFELAQAAGQQYVENVRRLSDRQDAICARRDAESMAKSDEMLRATREKCRAMEQETRRRCAALEAEAKQRADDYWQEVSHRLHAFYDSHRELKKLLSIYEG